MFKIRFRNRKKSFIVIDLLSNYSSFELAKIQAKIFSLSFPDNTYYVEKCN